MSKIDQTVEYDQSIMQLPYDIGDTVFAFDISEERAFKAKVVQLALPKKHEHRQVIITLEVMNGTDAGQQVRKTLEKSVIIGGSSRIMEILVEQHYRAKLTKLRNMNLDKEPLQL